MKTLFSKRLFSWNDVCLLFEHTHILNFISFRACPDHEKLIGDSFYKAFGMLYVNYSWSRTFGKVQDFKDKQRLSLTNVDENYLGLPFVVVLFIKHPPRIGGGLYSSIIFHSVCHSVIPSIVPDIILPDITLPYYYGNKMISCTSRNLRFHLHLRYVFWKLLNNFVFYWCSHIFYPLNFVH